MNLDDALREARAAAPSTTSPTETSDRLVQLDLYEKMRLLDFPSACRRWTREANSGPVGRFGSSATWAGRALVPRWRGKPVDRLVVATHPGVGRGLGEAIQYARFLPAARERAQHLTLVVDAALHDLLGRHNVADSIVGPDALDEALQHADAYSLLFCDLAHAVGAEGVPPLPITANEPMRLLEGRQHVGVAWRTSDPHRDLDPRTLVDALAGPGIVLHSLTPNEEAPQGVVRHDLSTWDATANVVAGLDAVVAADSSVLHLSASMGKPVHAVLTRAEDWRWGTGPTSVLYPSVRIHRQPSALRSLREAKLGDGHPASPMFSTSR